MALLADMVVSRRRRPFGSSRSMTRAWMGAASGALEGKSLWPGVCEGGGVSLKVGNKGQRQKE